MNQSELFDCPVCYAKYQKHVHIPKILSSCGHTLCSTCLAGIIRIQRNPSCPLDRVSFDGNLTTAEEFPTNILILQLIDEKDQEMNRVVVCTGDVHKEPTDLICMTDKCKVCKACAENENHKGHYILHTITVKNNSIKKKQELENYLMTLEKEIQPAYTQLKTQKENTKLLIKDKFKSLVDLLKQRENQMLIEADDFFFQRKIKIDEIYNESYSSRQEIILKIASLENEDFNQEFLEALDYNPLHKLDVKKIIESMEENINQMKKKFNTSFEDMETAISTSIATCKPFPPTEKISVFTLYNSPNLFFYNKGTTCKPSEISLAEIHEKWFGNYSPIPKYYKRVIQWLFPNFHSCSLNVHSVKLQKHEAEIFRTDIGIALGLIKSYILILDFFGIQIDNPETGELKRAPHSEKRYQFAFIENDLYYLIIGRVLECLNVTGFRKYAVQLVNFLEKEIYGEVGVYLKKNKEFNQIVLDAAPLKKLAENPKVFDTFSLFGEHYDDAQRIKLLEENCLAKYPNDFEKSIYFKRTDELRNQ